MVSLSQIETVVFDCDGVLWKGATVLPGAIETVSELRRRGLTEYSAKLKILGFRACDEEVICPSFLAQKYFQKNLQPCKKVYLIGPKCLKDELEAINVSVLSDDRNFRLKDFDELEKIDIDEDVSHVLVSFDRDITLDKIVRAAEYVKNGATCLATNLDSVLHLKEKVQ
ncbi:unnamed protein product [Oikopleura dioica]|uniref:Uncharacterized protein n=1 Tax=Oikopleura dioica TaxID=34765 RepID=E4YTX2_OIKDI|nr:unnamed protein product [Oikopleura dioica]